MEIRNLGASGLRVSAIGLGCNNFGGRIDQAATRAVIHAAIDVGITLFDTADVYGERGGSETAMGQVLGAAMRKDIVLATKFGIADGRRRRERGRLARAGSCRRSRTASRRLKTDWIDLYQLHQPDPRTPIEETLRALDDLVRAGQGALRRRVQHAGLAGGGGATRSRATCGLTAFVSCQDEYSLLVRDVERELMPGARARARHAALFPAGERAC